MGESPYIICGKADIIRKAYIMGEAYIISHFPWLAGYLG